MQAEPGFLILLSKIKRTKENISAPPLNGSMDFPNPGLDRTTAGDCPVKTERATLNKEHFRLCSMRCRFLFLEDIPATLL